MRMGAERIIQILINAGALYAADFLIDGISFVGEWWKFLLVALAFSLLNTYLRPILRILTFPITIVTMGIFLLVINAAMLMLTSAISDQLGSASRSPTSGPPSSAPSSSRSWAGSCRWWSGRGAWGARFSDHRPAGLCHRLRLGSRPADPAQRPAAPLQSLVRVVGAGAARRPGCVRHRSGPR
jgi:Predicted membrane protein